MGQYIGKKRTVVLLLMVLLIGIVIGFTFRPVLYPNGGETKPLEGEKTEGKVVFWKGLGSNPNQVEMTMQTYENIRSELQIKLNERLIAVGYGDAERRTWLVVIHGLYLPEEDLEFVKSLFPTTVALEIVGVQGCDVTILESKPPIIQIHC